MSRDLIVAAAGFIGRFADRVARKPRPPVWAAGCTICGYQAAAAGPVDAYELIRSHHCPPRAVK